MDLACILEYPSVPGGEARKLHLIVRMETHPAEGGLRRKPLNVALVIDRSGSMSGEKLRYTKQAAVGLLDRLTTADCLSLVSYSREVTVHLPPTKVVGKDVFRTAIDGIVAEGSTNLSGGWLRGLALLAEHAGEEYLSRAILLTDGQANEGVTGEAELAEIARQHREKGLHSTTIGFGVDFNEELLMSVADEGGGRFYYVEQPEDAPGVFLKEFGELSRVFGQNVDVCLEAEEGRPAPEVLGDLPVETSGSSATVRLGDILEAERKEAFFALAIPEGLQPGTVEVARVRVRYDAVRGETGSKELSLPVTIDVTPPGTALPERDQAVAKRLALYEIARRKKEASRRLRSGDTAGATSSLERASHVTQTSLHLDPAAFSRENETLTIVMDSLKIREHLEEVQKTLSSEAHDFHRGRGSYEEAPAGPPGRTPREFSLGPGQPEEVREVIGSIEAALAAAGHDKGFMARAEYVSGELIANALEHGCRDQPDPGVHIRFEVDRNRFRCTVEDNGPGFDFKDVLRREKEVAAGGGGAGGRGLWSVKQAADALKFGGRGNSVTVTLKKRRFKVKAKRQSLSTAAGKIVLGIATVEGGVDSRSYGMLEERLDELIKGRGVASLVVDLSACTYLSSTGIGVMAKAQRAVARSGGRVVIVGARPFIRRLFDATGLSASFEFADTLEAAKRLLSAS